MDKNVKLFPEKEIGEMEGAMDIETVLKNLEIALLRLPNVTAVGIGNKNGKDVINVFVKEKIPEPHLNKAAVIPKRIETFETDVWLERRKGMRNADAYEESDDISSLQSAEILSRMRLIICSAN